MTTPKISKSWIITIITLASVLVLPVINDSLLQYNIIITADELDYYLAAFLSTAGFGTAAAVRKQLKEGRTVFSGLSNVFTKSGTPVTAGPGEQVVIVNKKTPAKLQPPKLGPIGDWYQTNFEKGEKGNVLKYGQSYLWIKMVGVRSYVSVKLMTADGVPIQIDQSSEFDEDNDIETTRLEMFQKDGTPLPKGDYIIQSVGDRSTSDSNQIHDKFSII